MKNTESLAWNEEIPWARADPRALPHWDLTDRHAIYSARVLHLTLEI